MMKFDTYSGSILTPTPILFKQEGIYDVNLTIVSATNAEIVFKATVGCADNEDLTSIVLGNVELVNGAGDPQTFSLTGYDAATGNYTITGALLTSGFLSLKNDGVPAGTVFEKAGRLYESNKATVTVV